MHADRASLQCIPGDSDDDSEDGDDDDMSDDSEENETDEPLLAIEKKARLLDKKR